MAQETKTTGKKKEAPKAKPVVKTAPKPVEKKEAPKKVEAPVVKKEAQKKEKVVKKQAPTKAKRVIKKKSYTITRTTESSAMGHEKARLEKKKGKFKRQNFGKKKRIPDKWITPRGIDSGHREDEKHKPAHPRSGYMTPQHVKGLDVTGFEPVRVFNVAGLASIDSKRQAIIIASAVGMKKRIEIQKVAQEKKIQILNYKDAPVKVAKTKE